MPDDYIPDSKVYHELQVLKDFVQFITALKVADDNEKRDAETIIERIESLDRFEKNKTWNVSLNIFDRELQDMLRIDPDGVYWRSWSVYFERGYIEIVAKSRLNHNPPYDLFDEHYYYYYAHYFNKDSVTGNHIQSAPLADFVNDAKNYRHYITAHLNDIELDVSV